MRTKVKGFDLDVAKKILTKAMCAEARKTKDYFAASKQRYPLGIDDDFTILVSLLIFFPPSTVSISLLLLYWNRYLNCV
jgi:hypothetical protein